MGLSEMPKLTVSMIKSKIHDLDSEVLFFIQKARMLKAEKEREKRKLEAEEKKEKKEKKDNEDTKDAPEDSKKEDEKPKDTTEEKPKSAKKKAKIEDEGLFKEKELDSLKKKIAEV